MTDVLTTTQLLEDTKGIELLVIGGTLRHVISGTRAAPPSTHVAR
ncbi:hypothetical protein ACX80S_18190 [Arthrobacter sp. RHLT1-20]